VNGRIAEFAFADDAMAFMRLKGEREYTVCPGMNYLFAVRPKEHYETCDDQFCEKCADVRYEVIPGTLGRPDEPPDYRPVANVEDDDHDE